MKTYVLFNPLSGNPESFASAMERIRAREGEGACYLDIREIGDWKLFFADLSKEDRICLCGGDGTINRFVNAIEGLSPTNEVLYWATGTGNDFLKDLDMPADAPVRLNEYIRDLPTVTVKGKRYRFLNGVGYGIDGYCCEVGDAQKAASDKPVNYTAIAIKGLLFHYRPTRAHVTVDGKEYDYKRVWLAPTMHGRFYGGGMMPTPGQERMGKEGNNSLLLIHNSGKLHTLMVFPSIFQGAHLKHKKIVALHEGKNIKVRFDRPVALQIDGETILGVSEYEVSGSPVRVAEPAPAAADPQ